MARCSFCSESATATRPLVSGQGVAICADCARLALDVVESADPPSPDMVLRDVGTLLTMDARRGTGLVGQCHDVAVAIKRSRVVWIGDTVDIPEPYRALPTFDCDGRLVMPGLVDAATRPLGGPRQSRTDPDVLSDMAVETTRRMVSRGVTMIDLQVGGGSEMTVETLELAVARAVAESSVATVSVTWRCSIELSAEEVVDVMAPTASRLATSALVECHGGSPDDLARRLEAVKPMKVRLDCMEPVPDACRPFWPVLESMHVRGMPAHFESKGRELASMPPIVVPWSTPGLAISAWALGRQPALATMSHPDERSLAGMGVVLLAAVDLAGLAAEQAVYSVTRAAALAVGDRERGTVGLGAPADLVVAEAETVDDLLRRPDDNPAWAVIVGGHLLST